MIASYQIHNVLKMYTDRLSKKRRLADLRRESAPEPQFEMTSGSDERRRDDLVERLAADIVARIQHEGPRKNLPGGKTEAKFELDREPSRNESVFVYNVIHGGRCKKTVRLSLDDPDFLLRRIAELADRHSDGRSACK